jgi:hypothetical protein
MAQPLRIMSLHALAYCERLFYLEEVEATRVADERVYAGRRLHVEIEKKEDQRTRKGMFYRNPTFRAARRNQPSPIKLKHLGRLSRKSQRKPKSNVAALTNRKRQLARRRRTAAINP